MPLPEKLNVQMPKEEAHDRLRYKRDVEAWRREPQVGRAGGRESIRAVVEPNAEIGVAQRLLGLCCVYDGDDAPIDPGWGGFRDR